MSRVDRRAALVQYSPEAFGGAEIELVEALADFGEELGEEFGADPEDDFAGRTSRKRRRKSRRKRIRKKLKKGVKKIAKNKITRAIAKTALSIVPGGSAVGMGVGAAARAGRALRRARRKSPTANNALQLAKAARKGDKRALATLKIAAAGGQSELPPPRTPSTAKFAVKAPSGKVYSFTRAQL